MGDAFTYVIDVEATETESADLAERLISRMISAGYLTEVVAHNVLGGDGMGYSPGPNAYAALSASERDLDAGRSFPLDKLWTNGVRFEVKRHVFHNGGNTEGLGWTVRGVAVAPSSASTATACRTG